MSRRHLRSRARPAPPVVAVLAALVLLAACSGGGDDVAGGDDGGASPSAVPPSAAVEQGSEPETIPLPGSTATPSPPAASAEPAPPQRSVTITSPAEGATVSSPVTLEVRVEGFALAPIDGSFEEDSGHLNAYIDAPLPTEQERIPEGPEIVRFSEPRVELPELPPGEHTVGVIAVHGYPVPMMPLVTDEVTFTVE